MISLSCCVSVCNESEELDRLLTQLISFTGNKDEIIVLVDESKVTKEVNLLLAKHIKNALPIKIIRSFLHSDFAAFKNNFLNYAAKEWIMQIDADELLSGDFLNTDQSKNSFKSFIEMNPDTDLFWIARENYVKDLSSDYIQKWKWKIDKKGRINWKDPQPKIFKNNGNIRWKNKVHEILHGFTKSLLLPENYFLIHIKSAERQIKQNEFYYSIMKTESEKNESFLLK